MNQVATKSSKTEIAPAGNSPAEMIRLAVSGGADLSKLEQLLTIQERWEANEAKKAYNRAISEFKANPPKIEKDKTVSFSGTSYRHASLANALEKITAELSKHGLSATWRTSQNGQISVTCRIAHVFGHYEETTLSADADKSGAKNSIQALGSTVTYLERYTLFAALGLAAHDQDDDGRAACQTIDEKQAVIIGDYIDALKIDKTKFLKFFGIGRIEDMPKTRYQEAVTMLKTKEGKK